MLHLMGCQTLLYIYFLAFDGHVFDGVGMRLWIEVIKEKPETKGIGLHNNINVA